ncbi:similar to Saccharomyces cerevisiae YLR077W FMP25 Mitochondrial inner membrane protein required for an early step in assembly of respiratory complex III (cytochrome bc1 complex) [Maudiozyma saulgeensis]|uniref:Similar to Saccharomyces cerevisiae YLR077W FMP25 Mitochondrial inner membrane protein required for an early step in assembly of respiratory complex III (Cytochrome bc1 complex) n=1 Tax=Maudiozyma saulgeensis TaxID=1789683 RepID=A0A1X7R319_9SACH|nr:similar to Saccharomyces cerevisiae YLR077W FMP25 Mitochondrial inner membrane protein required for an early step in assembly of respiratory complex III (cytochrome bc1 complex) [Kazachstania saulgeensis]
MLKLVRNRTVQISSKFVPIITHQRIFIRTLINEPKYDDAEILAKGINNKEFKSKRVNLPFLSNEDAPDSAKELTLQRMKKLQNGSLIFVTLLGLTMTGSYYIYDKKQRENKLLEEIEWASISDGTMKKKSKKKKKNGKLSKVKPFIPLDQLDSSEPGLYIWGECTNDTEWASIPKRVTQFDGMTLRDVCLINRKMNLVIDNEGNLLKWDQDNNEIINILMGQKLTKIKESNDIIYGLNDKGEILMIPLENMDSLSQYFESHKRVGFLPKLSKINEYKTYGLKIDTSKKFDKRIGEKRIIDFDTGSNHLVLLSNASKAYSCSTGLTNDESKPIEEKSRGQFGIPTLSQYSKYPNLNELYEIELLNKSFSTQNQDINFRKIVKIACGDYHTVAIDSEGHFFTFGWNRFGQLGFNISYENEIIPYPKQLSMTGFIPFFNDNPSRSERKDQNDSETTTRILPSMGLKFDLKCVDICCAKETTYMSIANSIGEQKHFSMGNGSNGELGDGSYRNSQFQPQRIKIDGLIEKWIGNKNSNHIICEMNNGNIESWGLNNVGQIGNWQKNKFKFNKPERLPLLIEPGKQYQEDEDLNKLPTLQIDTTRQSISIGKNSSCMYWKSK